MSRSTNTTVRPLLSAILLSAELDYPQFLDQSLVRPTSMKYSQTSMIRTSIIRGPRLSANLVYPRFLRPKFSMPKYRG